MPDILQRLKDHFEAANTDWEHIADDLQVALAVPTEDLLRDRPASRFILTWMHQARAFHRRFSRLIQRAKQPPLADEFTAAVALCLKQFLTARGFPDSVRCEHTTHKKRGATRPDISVWQGDDLVATVECKTNFGWKKSNWKAEFKARSDALRQRFPGCQSYLCVLTQKGWDPTEFLASSCCGTLWYCLSKVGIGKISDPAADILHPIEAMFLAILARLAK